MSIEQKASQKLRDSFADLSFEEWDSRLDPTTQLTLRARLEKDILARDGGVL